MFDPYAGVYKNEDDLCTSQFPCNKMIELI